uniref:Synaptic plasticity regulator PANTS n=1 Tax=Clastoptera arizonana TaxID=38151 RepID=A0A1B6CYQ7_9HEMI
MEKTEGSSNFEQEKWQKSWMIRPCVLYYEEYKDCKSIRGRFQQYFVEGKYEDCNPWKQDHLNCEKFKTNKDEKAYNEIISNEESRRRKRMQCHLNNKVWENRDSPPENWNAPLPEWMLRRYENTYLNLRALEIKEGRTPVEKPSCTIL